MKIEDFIDTEIEVVNFGEKTIGKIRKISLVVECEFAGLKAESTVVLTSKDYESIHDEIKKELS